MMRTWLMATAAVVLAACAGSPDLGTAEEEMTNAESCVYYQCELPHEADIRDCRIRWCTEDSPIEVCRGCLQEAYQSYVMCKEACQWIAD